MRELHLFAGAGGGILGGMLLGHTTVAAVEIEPYCQEVLRARQRDGILPEFPIFGDIREFDGRPWRGAVDVLCGGFPCQDISAAGKGAGIAGERSGLWKEYARLIGEIRPQFVFAENSPLLRTRGLGVVLQDLAEMGYDARWGVLGAWHVGAPHKRDRMWVLAHTSSTRAGNKCGEVGNQVGGTCGEHVPPLRQADRKDGANRIDSASDGESDLAHTVQTGLQRNQCTGRTDEERRQEQARPTAECGGLWWHTDPAEMDDTTGAGLEGTERSSLQGGSERPAITDPAKVALADTYHATAKRGNKGLVWGERSSAQDETGRASQHVDGPTEPFVGRVAHGVANRVDRLKAIGNGQVPQCAAMAFRILSQGLI